MMRQILALVMCSALLSACASTYTGPKPNFAATGAAAEEEVRKFSFAEGFFAPKGAAFRMGEDKVYTQESLRPLIEDVSPSAAHTLHKSQVWGQVGGGLLLAALGFLAAKAGDGSRWRTGDNLAYYGALGTSIVCSAVSGSLASSAAHRYNEELRAKFTPGISLQKSF